MFPIYLSSGYAISGEPSLTMSNQVTARHQRVYNTAEAPPGSNRLDLSRPVTFSEWGPDSDHMWLHQRHCTRPQTTAGCPALDHQVHRLGPKPGNGVLRADKTWFNGPTGFVFRTSQVRYDTTQLRYDTTQLRYTNRISVRIIWYDVYYTLAYVYSPIFSSRHYNGIILTCTTYWIIQQCMYIWKINKIT